MEKKQFTVSGMTCSACSARVEKAVSKTEGVSACSVNLISGVLKVEMSQDVTQNIINSVQSEGYGIKVGVERRKRSERENKLKTRLIISLPLVVLLMYIAMGGMVGLPQPKFFENPFVFALSQAVVALVVVVVNYSYFTVGFKNLVRLKPNMDSLVALGSSVSFLYGVFAIVMIGLGKDVHTYAHNLYFEGSAMIVALITLGKFLEEKSKNKTMGAIEKLIGLAPDTAVVLRDEKEIERKSADLGAGDIFILKDGFSVPADGEIVDGDGYADESMITGESIPVYKSVGDKAVCGTKFSGGYVKVKAMSVGEDTTVYKIVKLVEDANSTKVPIAGLADKISGIFVPVVIAIALTAFAIWLLALKDFAFAFTFTDNDFGAYFEECANTYANLFHDVFKRLNMYAPMEKGELMVKSCLEDIERLESKTFLQEFFKTTFLGAYLKDSFDCYHSNDGKTYEKVMERGKYLAEEYMPFKNDDYWFIGTCAEMDAYLKENYESTFNGHTSIWNNGETLVVKIQNGVIDFQII